MTVATKDDLFEQLKDVLVTEFDLPRERLQPAAHLVDDLDLDSIDWIDMAVALEAKTGRKLKEQDLEAIRTLQDVVDLIHRKLQADAD
jgi:acyl carrier protein